MTLPLELGPLFEYGAAEAAKDDPTGVADLYDVLQLLPGNPRPTASESWHTDQNGELRQLRYGSYRVLYLIETERIVLIQLGRSEA